MLSSFLPLDAAVQRVIRMMSPSHTIESKIAISDVDSCKYVVQASALHVFNLKCSSACMQKSFEWRWCLN